MDETTGSGYARDQLAKAFVTALSHEDAATRRRADERLERWRKVLSGMASGDLTVGSRTPVRGLPAWVTPEVVRGGFATGTPAAGGPLEPYEREAATRAGLPADRAALFHHSLTDAGLAELHRLLDDAYDVTLPEEAALLVVAWLVRAGDRDGALRLLETIEPFAATLRFTPRPAAHPMPDSDEVSRESAGEVSTRLRDKKPNARVAAMNEALAVWNPFADELLALWLETAADGRVASTEPPGWRDRAAALLTRYENLAARHTLCGKHRRPRENLAILRVALQDTLAGRPARLGLLQHAVDAMVRKRGLPGSPRHEALRGEQAAEAARPTHAWLAEVLLERLAAYPQDLGLADPDALTAPVTAAEAGQFGMPEGSVFPDAQRRVVRRAMRGPIPALIAAGVVPSAEVLAGLTPQLVASATASGYQDEALRRLMSATYRAFRNRRSLLLLNLERQVGFHELPWVQAVAGRHRDTGGVTRTASRQALERLAAYALDAFPGTITPNPLVRELDTLARNAGLSVPFVEELAADIFMGTFTPKFSQAATLAGELLAGSLYDRYYGIGYADVAAIGEPDAKRHTLGRGRGGFAGLCHSRAGVVPEGGRVWRSSPAVNGTVIEQAQILTTHNLAAIAHGIGVEPPRGWAEAAHGAFRTVCAKVARVHGNPRPLRTIKDAAYAWRQVLFFLSLTEPATRRELLGLLDRELARAPDHVAVRLKPALDGLRHVAAGGTLDDPDAPAGARRFLGWAPGGHWMPEIRAGRRVP